MKPVLQALVLAERVYTAIDGKKIIAGTFNRIQFIRKQPELAIEQPNGTKKKVIIGGIHSGSPYVYISLTDVCKNTKLILQFVNLTKNIPIFGKEIIVDSDDRLQMIEIALPLPPLNVPEAGTYAFEISCEGEVLGSYRIIAEEIVM